MAILRTLILVFLSVLATTHALEGAVARGEIQTCSG
jgi:hypothetical protein